MRVRIDVVHPHTKDFRGHAHCICELGLRRLVDVRGTTCKICEKPITTETYTHWGVTTYT